MSCFSYLPGLYTLAHWHRKHSGRVGHTRFLLTKLVEVAVFKSASHTKALSGAAKPEPFPRKSVNGIPVSPMVTVVVPCYVRDFRDEMVLGRLLRSLKSQTILAELILVNDASPCVTGLLQSENVINVPENRGPAAARNVGMQAALNLGADIIVFTDMDCVPEPGWLAAIVDVLIQNPSAHVVSGNTKPLGRTWLDRYHEMNGTLNGRIFQGQESLLYGTTCNLAVSAAVARDIRFNESFRLAAGEDIDFCFRVNSAGYSIRYAESAVTFHDYFYRADSTISRWQCFVRQFQKYAKGEDKLLEVIPDYYSYYERSEEIVSS